MVRCKVRFVEDKIPHTQHGGQGLNGHTGTAATAAGAGTGKAKGGEGEGEYDYELAWLGGPAA